MGKKIPSRVEYRVLVIAGSASTERELASASVSSHLYFRSSTNLLIGSISSISIRCTNSSICNGISISISSRTLLFYSIFLYFSPLPHSVLCPAAATHFQGPLIMFFLIPQFKFNKKKLRRMSHVFIRAGHLVQN